jgi:hypothetical protein
MRCIIAMVLCLWSCTNTAAGDIGEGEGEEPAEGEGETPRQIPIIRREDCPNLGDDPYYGTMTCNEPGDCDAAMTGAVDLYADVAANLNGCRRDEDCGHIAVGLWVVCGSELGRPYLESPECPRAFRADTACEAIASIDEAVDLFCPTLCLDEICLNTIECFPPRVPVCFESRCVDSGVELDLETGLAKE